MDQTNHRHNETKDSVNSGPMNKSYDFRQGLNAMIKQKHPVKLEINYNEGEGEQSEQGVHHREKIIFNSRQIRRMSNNYVKGNQQQ
jgi:hypothetical protein